MVVELGPLLIKLNCKIHPPSFEKKKEYLTSDFNLCSYLCLLIKRGYCIFFRFFDV